MRTLFCLLSLLPLLFLVGCREGRTAEGSLEGFLNVGSFSLSEEEVDAWVRRSISSSQISPELQAREQRRLVTELQLAQYAIDHELDQDPEYKLNQISALAGQTRREKIQQAHLSRTPTDEELRAYARGHEEFTSLPEQRTLAVLWVPAREQISLEYAREFCLEKTTPEERIKKGFGSLSIDFTFSQAHRYKGGQIGRVRKQDQKLTTIAWMKKAVEVAFELSEEGQVSEVITLDNKDSLLVLLQKISPAQERDFKVIKPILLKRWQQDKRQEREQRLEAEIQELYPRR